MISVLLVDDEPDLLEVAQIHLEKTGSFSVDTCGSAAKALRIMGRKQYDAIIADYDMPDMNGLKLLQDMRARGDTTPFIMLAGAGPEDVVIDALNAGATFFLRKGRNLDAPFLDLQHKIHLAVRRSMADRNLDLLSSVSRHDLLNKISALSGYVELIAERTTDDEILRYVKKQHTIIAAIHDQVRFIDDYGKIGLQHPCWQPLDMAIRRASSLLSADTITLVIEGTEGHEVFADPLLVKVFYNLIENSLRHGHGVTRIRVTAEEAGDQVLIVFEDDGIGIPESEKESVFFKGRGSNTGMGLYLIREILAVTGISIRENGVYGQGARFEIHVPNGQYRMSG